MAPIVIKDGKAVSGASQKAMDSSGQGGLGQIALALAAVLIGPAILMQIYEKVTAEDVDLSDFNIVTHYDKPAAEMMDSVVRIQFCAN